MREFGRYLLVKEIGLGGMATVHRAYTFGEKGFSKELAVKTIAPQYSIDKKFVTMMSDEARLVVELNHPNIVQTLDFGRVAGEYYIAMEYVAGLSYNDILNDFRERNETVPEAVAIFVISELAKALQFAHSRVDSKGQSLQIVHRDVTPHNVLISYDGNVKLADFGIAKAATNVAHTQVGFIKGKIAYMSPEQARGEALDGRSDIFALGLVLFESLTFKRFFSGDSMAILHQLQMGTFDIDTEMNNVPEKYREILKKALAKDVNARYQNAFDFYHDLAELLKKIDSSYSSFQMSEFVKSNYPKKVEQETKEHQIDVGDDVKERLMHYTEGRVPASEATSYLDGSKEFTEKPTVTSRGLGLLRDISIPVILCVIVFSLVSDVMRPVFFLLPAFAGISLVGMLIAYVVNRKKLPREKKIFALLELKGGGYFIFFMTTFVVWTLLAAVYWRAPERGLLASSVPAVAGLQDKLFNIESGVEEIKAGIKDMQKDVKDIKTAIENLNSSPTIIKDASKPAELYHNARLYALWGETDNAIKAYQAFIEKAPDYVDANESFVTLLKNTQGLEAAKKVYEKLRQKFPDDPTIQMMYLKLLDPPYAEKVTRLEELLKKHPTYAPAEFEIFQTYYDHGWVSMTYMEKNRLKEAMNKVKSLDGEGYFKRYFIDKDALEKRYALIENIAGRAVLMGAMAQAPVSLSINYYSDNVGISITLGELGSKEIQYAVDDPNKMQSTGTDNYIKDPLTQLPIPNSTVNTVLPAGKHNIFYRYRDRNDKWSDVFKQEIDIRPMHIEVMKLPGSLGSDSNDVNVLYTIYEPYKRFDMVKEIKYSLNDKSLNLVAIPTNEARIQLNNVKRGSHVFYAKVIYSDGTQTGVLEYPFNN